MKKLFFTLTLGLTLTGPILAQPSSKDGYKALLAAANRVTRSQSETRTTQHPQLTPNQLMQRKRAHVDENQKALTNLRAALKKEITIPPYGQDEQTHARFKGFLNSATVLTEEADVRAADGDTAGALDSLLTLMELGAALQQQANGFALTMAMEIEGRGQTPFAKLVHEADLTTLKESQQRLTALEAHNVKFSDVDKADLDYQLQCFNDLLTDKKALTDFQKMMTSPEYMKEVGLTSDQVNTMFEMTPEELINRLTQRFEIRAQQDELPYPETRKSLLPQATDALDWLLDSVWYKQDEARFQFELNLTQRRLLQGALALEITKQEKGDYPENYNAPIDPFGDATPLIYTRNGDTYSLYSIGPDGLDDGGAEIQTLEINPETGARKVTDKLTPASLGDIQAPVLAK